jgi:hypothetical protein
MSPRERNMAIVLIALILLFVSGAVGYALVYQPLSQKQIAAAALVAEIQKKQGEYDKLKEERKRLAILKERSLPADQALAHREYSEMMSRLLQQAKAPQGFRIRPLSPDNTGTPTLSPKKLAYTKLAFEITFEKADMWVVHDFLKGYYTLGLLHQITSFDIHTDSQPASTTRGKPAADTRKNLDVKLVTEAIILDGADSRRTLLAVPSAFAAVGGMAGFDALLLTPEATRGLSPIQFSPVLATRPRDYTFIVQNDLFHGPLPPLPSIGVEKIADIASDIGKPIDPVKIRLSGDLGPTGKVTLEAKADGKILPAGSVKIDSEHKTLTLKPAKGLTGEADVTVTARTEEGKQARARFSLKITDPDLAKGSEEKKKLPDISDSIKLIIVVTGSDGKASAVIRDNYNPLTYEIEVTVSGRIKVTKYEHFGARKKKDRTYDDPELLIFSDDGISSTKRTFKVVAIDSEGLIVADLKPEKDKDKPKGPAKVMAPMPRGDKSSLGAADPLSVIAGVAVLSLKPVADPTQPTLYRWTSGGALSKLKEVPKDEAKKILQKASESGPVGATSVAATGN